MNERERDKHTKAVQNIHGNHKAEIINQDPNSDLKTKDVASIVKENILWMKENPLE